MRKKRLTKALAVFLTASMLMQNMPISVFADSTAETISASSAGVSSEINPFPRLIYATHTASRDSSSSGTHKNKANKQKMSVATLNHMIKLQSSNIMNTHL